MTRHGTPRGNVRYELLVCSFGGGQDSTAILYRWLDDPDFRAAYSCNRFLLVMSSVGEGEEHPQTYEHIRYIEGLCEENSIEFYFIVPAMGFHGRTWQGLRQQYRRNATIGSKAFPKSCTDNLKIKPIYDFLNEWVSANYNLRNKQRKAALIGFAKLYGQIGVMLGIAADEAKRRIKGRENESPWMRFTIDKLYPMVEWGWNRRDAQMFMFSTGRPVPWPSNCMICHFLTETELVWLFRAHPDRYEEWMSLERAKIDRVDRQNAAKVAIGQPVKRNLGVFGERLLPEVLAGALTKYGHMTLAELDEYKFSHGHCVTNSY